MPIGQKYAAEMKEYRDDSSPYFSKTFMTESALKLFVGACVGVAAKVGEKDRLLAAKFFEKCALFLESASEGTVFEKGARCGLTREYIEEMGLTEPDLDMVRFERFANILRIGTERALGKDGELRGDGIAF